MFNSFRIPGFKSPSGEGKSYVLHKVGENFPPEDVMFVAGMTDRALFHRTGKLVLKNEIGDYESQARAPKSDKRATNGYTHTSITSCF